MTKPEESMRIIQSSSSKQEVDSETEEFIVETEESPGGGTRATIISGGNSVARYKDDEDEDDLINNSRDERDEEDFDDEFGPSPKRTKGSPSKIKYTQRYKKEWESKPEFKLWLSESVHGNQYFYCKFCKRDNRCGISEIQKHMTSKKHMSRASLPGVTARKFKFRGLLCPVFTPFKSTCHKKMVPEVNFRGIPKYAQFLKACNVQGVFINDYLGEGMALTVQERMQLTEAWMKACSKTEQFLMVQIGGAPLKDIIEMAVHAEKNKVGAVVVLPDLYNRPKNHLDVLRYLKMVSEHTGNIPLLYHHNPKYTQVEIDISAMLLEIPDEIDSFAGLIYTTNDLRECIAASTVNAEKYTVFMGTEEIILGAAASGITCIMANSLNFLPKVVEAIYEESRKGNIKAAQASQSFINKALDVISKHGDPLAAFKAATNIITEEACGNATRAPIQELWEGTVKKLHEEMSKLGII